MLPKFPIDEAFPSYLGRLKDFVVAVSECYQVPVDAAALLVLPIMALGLSKRFEVEAVPRMAGAAVPLRAGPLAERRTEVCRAQGPPRTDLRLAARDRFGHGRRPPALREQGTGPAGTSRSSSEEGGQEPGDRRWDRRPLPRARRHREQEASPPVACRHRWHHRSDRSLAGPQLRAHAPGIRRGRRAGHHAGPLLRDAKLRCVAKRSRWRRHRQCASRAEADRLEKPALQVALCVQPGAVLDLIGSQAAQERGVVPRFFLSLPESKVGFRELQSEPILPT